MHLVAHGDQEAFAELYERLSGGLFSFAYLILFDHGQCADVVEEVFIAIWKNAPSFDIKGGSVLSWAITMTRNRAYERIGARNPKPALPRNVLPVEEGFGNHFIATMLTSTSSGPLCFQQTKLIYEP